MRGDEAEGLLACDRSANFVDPELIAGLVPWPGSNFRLRGAVFMTFTAFDFTGGQQKGQHSIAHAISNAPWQR
ncbi:MAG: hypothetical protein KGM42_18295 [Hyphomicrobiales bacterium]|nr:hypothetical protein [Hyphomicrobiales bacterium]